MNTEAYEKARAQQTLARNDLREAVMRFRISIDTWKIGRRNLACGMEDAVEQFNSYMDHFLSDSCPTDDKIDEYAREAAEPDPDFGNDLKNERELIHEAQQKADFI